MLKFYHELTCLIQPELNEAELKTNIDELEAFIGGAGKILGSTVSQKINLQYPVKKKGAAFLLSISFETDPRKIIKIKQEMDKKGAIMRFLIIKKRFVKEENKPAPKENKKETEPTQGKKEVKEKKVKLSKKTIAPKTKIEMEEIERDLEKILDFQSEDEEKPKFEL